MALKILDNSPVDPGKLFCDSTINSPIVTFFIMDILFYVYV